MNTDDRPNTKRCSRCRTDKPIEEFGKNKAERDGYQYACKKCMAANAKNYRQPKHVRLAHRDANKEHFMFLAAKARAKLYNREFSIEESDIVIPERCPVFGISLKKAIKFHSDCSPSLDRIDNTKGYIKGNIVVVSWLANRLKNSMPLSMLKRLSDFYCKENAV